MLPIDCHEGAMRLVGGSNNSEGRVEVCVNGRWGAIKVCGVPDQTEAVASILCDQLGFSEHSKFEYRPVSIWDIYIILF